MQEQQRQRPRGSARSRIGGIVAGALAVLCAVALAACGGSSGDDGSTATTAAGGGGKLDTVRLQLDWIPKEEYAFLFAGKERGVFERHGIDLQINTGRGSVLAMQVLNGGASDLAYVNVGSYVQALSEGAQGVAIYGVIQQEPQMIVSYADNAINSIGDLTGRSLITSSTEGFALYYEYLLRLHGVDPSSVRLLRVDPAAKGPTFASRRGDAMNWYQSVSLAPLEDQVGERFVTLPSQEWDGGQLNVAENLIGLPDYLEANGDVVRRMTAAMAESWEWAEENPEEAAKVIRPMLANAPLEQVTAAVEQTMKLGHTPASEGRPTGWMAPEDWEATIRNLTESGLARGTRSADSYYTNDYVPGGDQ